MGLTDVSNDSLNKLYDCMSKMKLRAMANFSRLNYRLAELARMKNCLSNKIECDEVSLVYDIEENVIHPSILINRRCMQGQAVPMKAMSTLMQKFSIQKISSRNAQLANFIVNSEFLVIIRENLRLKSGSLEKLTFASCKFECSANEFFETLGYLKIKRLDMDYVVLNQFYINNTHLSTLLLEIRIVPIHHGYSDINDQMLMNFYYETPEQVHILQIKTEVTLQALLLFIEKMVIKMNKSSVKFKHQLFICEVKADSDSRYQLLLAQRAPQLTWEALQYGTERHKIQYKVTHDKHDLEIRFSVTTVECPKITKRQARRRIDNLRAKMRRNLEENDAYLPTDDMEVMIEVRHLQGSLFDDWTELNDIVYRLQYPEMEQIHEADAEDDDDQE